MRFETKIVALVSCVALAVLVFELVRRRRVREEYSLPWFTVIALFSALVLFDGLTGKIIRFLGGANISSLFFFGGVAFAILMLLHFTVRVSELKRKQNVLIQEAGLLRQELEQLQAALSPPENGMDETDEKRESVPD